jgi:hypothetical protein
MAIARDVGMNSTAVPGNCSRHYPVQVGFTSSFAERLESQEAYKVRFGFQQRNRSTAATANYRA